MSELEIDLSPTWLADQVLIRGQDDPVVWHPSLLVSGNTRLHFALPAGPKTPGELVVTVRATSTVSGGRGPLELPRVRPMRTPIIDEAWVAWVDQGTMIQPTLARGVAWIDPNEVPGLLAPGAAGVELREALAWRWIGDSALARVDRESIEQDPGASIRVHARIDPARQRLILDGRLLVYAGAGPLDTVPLWIGQADSLLESWRFSDVVDGMPLAMRPIEEPERVRLGFPKEGLARSLVVKIPYQSEKTIAFHAEYPWKNGGAIPLLSPSRSYLSRGIVVVETPANMQSRVQTVGLRRLAGSAQEQGRPETGGDSAAVSRDGREPVKNEIVDAFAYSEPGGRLEVFTEPLTATASPAIVREALLTTAVDSRGSLLNRLRLLVNVLEARTLDFIVPRGLTLVRVRRDGADVTPIESPTGFSIPLTGAGPGSKLSSVVVDYQVDRATMADGGRLRPVMPRVSLPCLSFVWEVATGPAWRATDPGPGLIGVDRAELFDWPFAPLAVPRPAWNAMRSRGGVDEAEVLRGLGERLADSVSADLTFAEWFSRWDSGPWPVVIDRVALGIAGLGPRSQCVPTMVKNEGRNVPLATLKRYGLALVTFRNVFVITTESELPRLEPRDRWAEPFTEALLWGSDRRDRFQTLARWRGEPSPKLGLATGDETALGIKPPPGWSTWTFEGPGWPEDNAFVYVIDMRIRMVVGWMVVGLCFLAWAWCRGWFSRWRLLFLTLVMALCQLTPWLLPSRFASPGAAVYLGAFVLLLVELGRALWQPYAPDRARRRSESSLVRRGAGAALSLALAILLSGTVASVAARAQADHGRSILALFPYDGPFDPKRPARDVILRLADYDRLRLLAERLVPQPASIVRAVGAQHRVTPKSAIDVVVDSEIELMANGHAPFVWYFPVSFAHDIQVSLDGKRIPIEIEAGASRGSVSFAEAGPHRLRIRRSAAPIDEDGWGVISLPVNAMPFARVVVEPGVDGRQDGELVARGKTEVQPDHTLIGSLGPADRVLVRWKKPAGTAIERSKGNLEGLILWDITPAGDRVRARLTFRQLANLSTIRLAHQQGLILRSAKAIGSVDTYCEENAETGEWIVRVNPPLPAGSTIELDCWLPLGAGKSPPAPGMPGGSIRDLPRLQPVGAEIYSGALGVRRPGDWTGRFDPLPDTDAINDESFVEAWGSLPQEPLTLCGTSRFVRECRGTLQTGPVPPKVQVKPTIQVQIESGRVAISVEAELSELAGHLRHLQAEVPENIQIIEVTADGLSDWTISADHRLHLMFDRPVTRPKRRLRIVAWIPLSEEPLEISTRKHQVKTPWFRWDGTESLAGFLTISSISKPEMRGSTGLTLISAESSRAGVTATPRYRSTYRVDDPGKLGEILWESVQARVSVSIESQMTIHPDSAEWVAVLRYDVIGGALDAIRLRMPAAWAANAELRFSGSQYQLTRETSGLFSFWSITPERPIWGSQRFVLRATRSLDSDREIDFPEISPLGQGAVDAYLGVVDATDRSLTIENTAGLQSIPFATRFHAAEFDASAGKAVNAFRVSQKSWNLTVQSPRSAFQNGDWRRGSVRLALADLMAVVMPDRSFLGRAVYETVPGTGADMSFALPADSSLLWATVDLNPVVPLRSASGGWSIACDDRRPSRIGLIWRTNPTRSSTTRSRSSVPLPRAGRGSTTTLVSIYTPPGLAVTTEDFGGLEPAGMARLEMARADWLARSARDLVGRFDRSSGREHEKLVSLLINHEMALRSAQRSIQWTEQGGKSASAVHDIELIRSARVARDEIIGRAGLENDLIAARAYLGETVAANLSHPLGGVPEPSAPDRIRSLGLPFTLIGVLPGIDATSSGLSLSLENQPLAALGTAASNQSVVTLILLLGMSLCTLFPARWAAQNSLVLAAALGLVAYTGGPLILAGALAITAVAWKLSRA
jgi:hypothetical protein